MSQLLEENQNDQMIHEIKNPKNNCLIMIHIDSFDWIFKLWFVRSTRCDDFSRDFLNVLFGTQFQEWPRDAVLAHWK